MKVTSLGGAGAMGRAASHELAANTDVDHLEIVDIDADAAQALAAELPGDVTTASVDVTDHDALVACIADSDVVANALPYAFNTTVMDACLDADAHYLDLGGLFHVTNEQLGYDDAFEDAGLTAVLGMGASPGMTNVAAAKGASRLDRVESIHIRTGAKGGASGFAYSAKTILDELTMNPVVYRDGDLQELEPLSGRERYVMPDPVGEVEGFHSIHSELATMPDTFPGIESVDFRVAFAPQMVELCENLIDVGLTSEDPVEFKGVEFTPREFLNWYLDQQPNPDPAEEWKSFRVDVTGEKNGASVGYRYEIVATSRLDDWGLNATAVWTGVPLGVASAIVGRGDAVATGAKPPETALDPDQMIETLADRDLVIEETKR